jgi:hypothetical protein
MGSQCVEQDGNWNLRHLTNPLEDANPMAYDGLRKSPNASCISTCITFLGHIILSYEYMIFFVYFEHTGVGTSL